eukprot:g37188.t1
MALGWARRGNFLCVFQFWPGEFLVKLGVLFCLGARGLACHRVRGPLGPVGLVMSTSTIIDLGSGLKLSCVLRPDPYLLVREWDCKVIRPHLESMGRRSSEQSIRSSIRQTIINNLKMELQYASTHEMKFLKDQGVLGRRAPNGSLIRAWDMCKLLLHFGCNKAASKLEKSLKKQFPSYSAASASSSPLPVATVSAAPLSTPSSARDRPPMLCDKENSPTSSQPKGKRKRRKDALSRSAKASEGKHDVADGEAQTLVPSPDRDSTRRKAWSIRHKATHASQSRRVVAPPSEEAKATSTLQIAEALERATETDRPYGEKPGEKRKHKSQKRLGKRLKLKNKPLSSSSRRLSRALYAGHESDGQHGYDGPHMLLLQDNRLVSICFSPLSSRAMGKKHAPQIKIEPGLHTAGHMSDSSGGGGTSSALPARANRARKQEEGETGERAPLAEAMEIRVPPSPASSSPPSPPVSPSPPPPHLAAPRRFLAPPALALPSPAEPPPELKSVSFLLPAPPSPDFSSTSPASPSILYSPPHSPVSTSSSPSSSTSCHSPSSPFLPSSSFSSSDWAQTERTELVSSATSSSSSSSSSTSSSIPALSFSASTSYSGSSSASFLPSTSSTIFSSSMSSTCSSSSSSQSASASSSSSSSPVSYTASSSSSSSSSSQPLLSLVFQSSGPSFLVPSRIPASSLSARSPLSFSPRPAATYSATLRPAGGNSTTTTTPFTSVRMPPMAPAGPAAGHSSISTHEPARPSGREPTSALRPSAQLTSPRPTSAPSRSSIRLAQSPSRKSPTLSLSPNKSPSLSLPKSCITTSKSLTFLPALSSLSLLVPGTVVARFKSGQAENEEEGGGTKETRVARVWQLGRVLSVKQGEAKDRAAVVCKWDGEGPTNGGVHRAAEHQQGGGLVHRQQTSKDSEGKEMKVEMVEMTDKARHHPSDDRCEGEECVLTYDGYWDGLTHSLVPGSWVIVCVQDSDEDDEEEEEEEEESDSDGETEEQDDDEVEDNAQEDEGGGNDKARKLEPTSPGKQAIWFMCDDCEKWRLMPLDMGEEAQRRFGGETARFVCALNLDPCYARCDIPEQSWPSEVPAVDMGMSQGQMGSKTNFLQNSRKRRWAASGSRKTQQRRARPAKRQRKRERSVGHKASNHALGARGLEHELMSCDGLVRVGEALDTCRVCLSAPAYFWSLVVQPFFALPPGPQLLALLDAHLGGGDPALRSPFSSSVPAAAAVSASSAAAPDADAASAAKATAAASPAAAPSSPPSPHSSSSTPPFSNPSCPPHVSFQDASPSPSPSASSSGSSLAPPLTSPSSNTSRTPSPTPPPSTTSSSSSMPRKPAPLAPRLPTSTLSTYLQAPHALYNLPPYPSDPASGPLYNLPPYPSDPASGPTMPSMTPTPSTLAGTSSQTVQLSSLQATATTPQTTTLSGLPPRLWIQLDLTPRPEAPATPAVAAALLSPSSPTSSSKSSSESPPSPLALSLSFTTRAPSLEEEAGQNSSSEDDWRSKLTALTEALEKVLAAKQKAHEKLRGNILRAAALAGPSLTVLNEGCYTQASLPRQC